MKVCGFRVKFVEVCEWFNEVWFVVEKILICINQNNISFLKNIYKIM